tara:strand:+ start:2867 stop:3127 length:261 start_codon:yes stop_codon:yes gene_type:complete
MTSSSAQTTIEDTYANDDWFDIDQYKKAAQVAYDFSLGKMEKQGEEERETIGKGGSEQRTTDRQKQEFSEKDEERDYKQSQKAYRF